MRTLSASPVIPCESSVFGATPIGSEPRGQLPAVVPPQFAAPAPVSGHWPIRCIALAVHLVTAVKLSLCAAPRVLTLYIVVQRDFLFTQALILLVLLQVISYYGIAMGRNLKGMVLGYGQCIGVTLITLAVRAYVGAGFQEVGSMIQQVSYLAALAIWLMNLWSYCANPVPEATIAPDADYDKLASRTRDMVAAASTQLVKVERL